MNAKTRKELLAEYGSEDRTLLAQMKVDAEKVLETAPDNEEAKNLVEIITEILSKPAATELEQLRAQNAALLVENAAFKVKEQGEGAIREKIAAGLSREQAESVVQQQADNDKEIARLEDVQKKAREEAAKAAQTK